ncbi:MAG: hypothetical protein QM661_12865 [Solimonas sp.]
MLDIFMPAAMQAAVPAMFFGTLVFAAALLYLTHPQQRWRARPLPVRPWRALGALLLIAAFAAGASVYAPLTLAFAGIALLMLVWAALPFASLLWRRA